MSLNRDTFPPGTEVEKIADPNTYGVVVSKKEALQHDLTCGWIVSGKLTRKDRIWIEWSSKTRTSFFPRGPILHISVRDIRVRLVNVRSLLGE